MYARHSLYERPLQLWPIKPQTQKIIPGLNSTYFIIAIVAHEYKLLYDMVDWK